MHILMESAPDKAAYILLCSMVNIVDWKISIFFARFRKYAAFCRDF